MVKIKDYINGDKVLMLLHDLFLFCMISILWLFFGYTVGVEYTGGCNCELHDCKSYNVSFPYPNYFNLTKTESSNNTMNLSLLNVSLDNKMKKIEIPK